MDVRFMGNDVHIVKFKMMIFRNILFLHILLKSDQVHSVPLSIMQGSPIGGWGWCPLPPPGEGRKKFTKMAKSRLF